MGIGFGGIEGLNKAVNFFTKLDAGDNNNVDGSIFGDNKALKDSYNKLIDPKTGEMLQNVTEEDKLKFLTNLQNADKADDGKLNASYLKQVEANNKNSKSIFSMMTSLYSEDVTDNSSGVDGSAALNDSILQKIVGEGASASLVDDLKDAYLSYFGLEISKNQVKPVQQNKISGDDASIKSSNYTHKADSAGNSAVRSNTGVNTEGVISSNLQEGFAKNAVEAANKYLKEGCNEGDGSHYKFGKSSGLSASDPWCAAFVHYVFKEANGGKEAMEGCTNVNYCPSIENWAEKNGIKASRSEAKEGPDSEVKPGDAIIFDWDNDGTADHIGMVTEIKDGKVYTIEGNSSNKVSARSYDLNSSDIKSYVKMNKKMDKQA